MGWALRHYAWNASGGRTTEWYAGKRDALNFDAEQYYEILREGNLMESLITSHWGVMGEADPRHRVKLVVDEWGTWYTPGTEPFPEALLGQQSTVRNAVLAGLTLDTFNRHADKVEMANVAQLVNCLQSPLLAHEDKFCVTPTYHVFAMFTGHRGGQPLRTLFSAPAIGYTRNGRPAKLPGLAGSAPLTARRVTLR
ncbi:MAG TPA: alpha-L-arabinofuranosidase C-terminal domain-containing protein [Bryobacteraceae bacterium]|nr:alpha-L-arabinofuranosidase C-terminal domain-containing protein [Bryobacteraceae bacterium]